MVLHSSLEGRGFLSLPWFNRVDSVEKEQSISDDTELITPQLTEDMQLHVASLPAVVHWALVVRNSQRPENEVRM